MAFLAPVHLHDGLCVDGQVLVRVHYHAEQPRIRLGNCTQQRVIFDGKRTRRSLFYHLRQHKTVGSNFSRANCKCWRLYSDLDIKSLKAAH